MSTLFLQNVTLGYTVPLIRDIFLSISKGNLVGLIGRNGAGKSTLLKSISGALEPLDGTIKIMGKDLNKMSLAQRSKYISLVTTRKIDLPMLSVYEVIAIGRSPYTNWIGRLTKQDLQEIDKAISLCGIEGFRDRPLSELSDGERQRVMVARAIAQTTPLILMDEPTAFLDLPNKYELGLLLQRLAKEEGRSILFSTHDLEMALELCDEIIVISDGYAIQAPPSELIERGIIERLLGNSKLHFDRHNRRILLT